MSRPNLRSARRSAVHTAVFSLALAGSLPLAPLAVRAGEASSGLADKEFQRRNAVIAAQQARLTEAEVLVEKGDTAAALAIYETAFTTLPDTPQAQELRIIALEGYLRLGLRRATELAEVGDYEGAKAILDKLDQPQVAPGDRRIALLRKRLADPDRFPPALTPEHVAKVNQVKKLLILANSQRETGQYDQALHTYEDVIRLDAYNSAARRGMELTEKERAHYFAAAKDHTRSKMLNEVDGAWEQKLPPQKMDVSGLFGSASSTAIQGGREAIQEKLRTLRISQIDFSGAALNEVMEYLRVRSRDLDPTGKGVDFVFSQSSDVSTPLISLNLRDVPIEEVLRYVTKIAGLTYRVEDYAVRLLSATQDSETLISKSYRVPPDFISSAPVGDAAATASADPFANTSTAAPSGLVTRRLGAQEFLQSYGVTFGEGTSASYSAATNTLIVRNTTRNIELVDQLVEQAQSRSPKQVVVEVRLLEVSDNRLNELGFDWLLGANRSQNVEFAGGSTGNAQDSNYLASDFPNRDITALGNNPIGQNPITAGLRSSGDLGLAGIDGVLFGGTSSQVSSRTPGILSVTGVMTDPQFQGVLRALDQKKGVDLTAQPSVVTRSGQKATVEIARELIYPTEFDPPQIPTSVGNNNLVDAVTGNPVPLPLPPAVITPSTPTAFETRKTGVILEVEPVISDDGRTVDLAITPDFTEFLGFVNYGSPIRSIYEGFFFELTPNLIFQPIFESKKVITAVKVWDGATIALGGLVTDREIIIQDKVPLVGDLPVVGRLFKSDVKQRVTKNIVFFVTVRVVDPSGARINNASVSAH
ncbi:general secretion pathway protein D [Prosthecobacter debontii]|uniref:General secretion pathway protein D n=1 Tax=Prosthecobacter debontii TaxID=48467 RepID=A0A1T4XZL5_9BACT|nr:Amuc_1098 family type IV pilus outer membrane protein [Prosthecobacter debontii]SKA94465.1 general secretion pathway protein D [Prosthecobacter debontii]